MVDRAGQLVEEPLQGGAIGGVERGRAPRVHVAGGTLEPLGIPADEDDVGALGPRAPGGLEPDSGAAADEHDGLPEELRLMSPGSGRGFGCHDSSSRGEACHLRVDRPDGPWPVHDLHAERHHGGVVDPREAREGLDRVVEDLQRDPRADRQRRLL